MCMYCMSVCVHVQHLSCFHGNRPDVVDLHSVPCHLHRHGAKHHLPQQLRVRGLEGVGQRERGREGGIGREGGREGGYEGEEGK